MLSPPHRDHRRLRRAPAFTLIEVLTVVAVVAILSTLTLGLVRGVKQRTLTARAKAELTHLSQSLEEFKRRYGDYPATGPSAANDQRVTFNANGVSPGPGLNTTPARLFNSLIGVYGPAGFNTRLNGPVLVEVANLTLEIPFSTPTSPTNNNRATFAVATGTPPAKIAQNNSFLDPWGNRYLYFYKLTPATTTWKADGTYVLYSTGPDGASTLLPNNLGLYTGANQTAGDNADNLHAERLP